MCKPSSAATALRKREAAAINGLAVEIIPKPLSFVRREQRLRSSACLCSHLTVGRPVLDTCLDPLQGAFGQLFDLIAKHAFVAGKVSVRAALVFPFSDFVLVQGQQYAVDLIFDKLRQRSYVRRDDRRAARHGLYRAVAERVAKGGQKQKMRTSNQVQDFGIWQRAVRDHVGKGIEKASILVQEAGTGRSYPGTGARLEPGHDIDFDRKAHLVGALSYSQGNQTTFPDKMIAHEDQVDCFRL